MIREILENGVSSLDDLRRRLESRIRGSVSPRTLRRWLSHCGFSRIFSERRLFRLDPGSGPPDQPRIQNRGTQSRRIQSHGSAREPDIEESIERALDEAFLPQPKTDGSGGGFRGYRESFCGVGEYNPPTTTIPGM